MRAEQMTSYWDRTHWPLQSLYFLLPLIIGYELGMWLLMPEDEHGYMLRISAERLVRNFFDVFGVAGYYLPGVLTVFALIGWHLMRQDPWKPEPRLYGFMAIESLLLAVPLFLLSILVSLGDVPAAWALQVVEHQPATYNGHVHDWTFWAAKMILALGAGVYEELLFRLIAIALLHALLRDLLALPETYSWVGTVAISSLAFSLYHFTNAPFDWGKFAFYTIAGVYFAVIYLARGFGIVAATHAIYDLIVVGTQYIQMRQAL